MDEIDYAPQQAYSLGPISRAILLSQPLVVMNPKMMSRIVLPPDSGCGFPVVEIKARLPARRLLRLLRLLESPDRRQRKRGMRLFYQEVKNR